MNPIEMLRELRAHGGQVRTPGLDDATIERFAASDATLAHALADAREAHAQCRARMPDFLALDEQAQIERAQARFVSFYADDPLCPSVALAARGPCAVTTKGALLYDCG